MHRIDGKVWEKEENMEYKEHVRENTVIMQKKV
jgi:hypothetical protein